MPNPRRIAMLISLSVVCLSFGISQAGANSLDITRFNARQGPTNMAVGPDGNIYYVSSEGDIGRVTPSGNTRLIDAPEDSSTEAIAAGPDGNIWYIPLHSGYAGRLTPEGDITMFPLPNSNTYPQDLTAGPDGAMWFPQPYPQASPSIGRITTDGVFTEFPLPSSESFPSSITAGPDGNLWFTERDDGKIGRITPDGVITEFRSGQAVTPDHITVGRDGKLWFADTYYGDVYRIGTDGAVTPRYITPPSGFDKGVEAIVATPADPMWIAGRWNYLGKIDGGHDVTEYRVRDDSITDLILGPGGDLWYGNGSTYEVARVQTGWNAVLSLDTGFLPRAMHVRFGARVRWQATGARPVQISADDGSFDSGPLAIGGRYLRRFPGAGSYPYADPSDGRGGVVQVSMTATPSDGPTTRVALRWALLHPPAGDRFDVQVRGPSDDTWEWFADDVAGRGGSFTPGGTGLFRFRARTITDGVVSGWSPVATATV